MEQTFGFFTSTKLQADIKIKYKECEKTIINVKT